MKPRLKRLTFILIGLATLGVAAALILNALRSKLTFFFCPSELASVTVPEGRAFRLGGLVEEGSVKREGDGLTVHFVVTDRHKNVNVTYKGILPDLFKEGQGIVALGKVRNDGVFVADEVLAKHDENYMPSEVMKALEQAEKDKLKSAPQTTTTTMGSGI